MSVKLFVTHRCLHCGSWTQWVSQENETFDLSFCTHLLLQHPSMDSAIHPSVLSYNSFYFNNIKSNLWFQFGRSWLMQSRIKHVSCLQPGTVRITALMFSPAAWVFYVPFTFVYMSRYIFFSQSLPPSHQEVSRCFWARCLWLLHTVSVRIFFRDTASSRGKAVKEFLKKAC